MWKYQDKLHIASRTNKIDLFEDIHNSWLYCFTNPLELGTRVEHTTQTADDAKVKHVSQVQED